LRVARLMHKLAQNRFAEAVVKSQANTESHPAENATAARYLGGLTINAK
jgi:hypothetical protein